MRLQNLVIYMCIMFTVKMALDNIDIYYESMCPPSVGIINFICGTIDMMGGFSRVHNIRFHCYGFAKDDGNKIVSCQHGDNECIGNKIHNCAIQKLDYETANSLICCMIKNINKNLFIKKNNSYNYVHALSDCKHELKIDNNELDDCYKGDDIELYMINYVKPKFDKIIETPHFIVDGADNKVFNLMLTNDPLRILCDIYNNCDQEILLCSAKYPKKCHSNSNSNNNVNNNQLESKKVNQNIQKCSKDS